MSKNKILSLEEEIKKQYGDVVAPADNLIETQGKIIRTLPSLDIALSGGLVEGTITVLTSPPKSGKTTVSLTICAAAQQQYKKKCFYVDVEGRIRTELLKTIPGLVWTEDQEKKFKIPRLQIIKSVKGSILTAEKYLDIIIKILINEPGCIVVLDSVAALCSESLWASNMGDSQRMAKIPSLMYEFMRKIAQVVPTMQSNLICITHLQAKLDPYKSQTGMGGNAQEFFASNNLISFSSKEEEDENGYKIGRNTVFKVTKSALGKPGGESTIYIRYGKGCDRLNDLISLGEQLGLIDVNGAWYMYNNEKFQGKKNIYNYLSSNKDISLKLEQEIYNLAFGDTTNESLVSI